MRLFQYQRFPSIIILLILFWKNINKKVTMLRVNLKREGNKVSMVFNTNTSPMPLQQNQLVNKGQINQPLTIRVSMGNDPSTSENQLLLTSSKVVDLKAVNAKKICDQVGELKKALNTFSYLEKDEDKYKLFILHWFDQIQAIFQNALNGKLSQHAEAQVQPELQAKNSRFPLPDQNTKPVLFINFEPSELITNKEIQNLKLEVQNYQKNSIQAVETIESIMKMVAVVEEKLEAERNQKKSILEVVTTYSDKLESILEKISAKYQKEKKITRLEREIQLILTRIKFKALNDINGYTFTVQ